ncbi:helix-turn-helix domain-containing protein [Leuconostoc sp. MS02]|uniref:Helix-turn-helix domain-containing protein n=1 Tax=Leuconostoc aquikimchii TaxID=3236804 RepID=A0ABV3S0A8_9LACO
MIDKDNFYKLNEDDLAAISGGSSEDIAQNLKSLRKTLGYKRSELAIMLNISSSTIAKYESGSRIPDIDTIIQLAELFNTNVNNLIYK